MDTWRKAHEEEHKKYSLSQTALMTQKLWELYVDEPLRHRPDLATHQSPYYLTSWAQELIPEAIKKALCELAEQPYDYEAWASGFLVLEHLGIDVIEQLSKEKQLSVQETIAILGTYLENHTNNCGPH